MKRVIAVANQKGGVGKTTTAVNLAASLAATKRRVMLIDLDPQGNATMGSGVDKSQLQTSSCEVLLGEAEIGSALVNVEPGGFVLLPANQDLTAAEVRLLTMMAGRETKLRNAIASLRESFDVILIDCPPALNMLTVNSLVAADSVLIPMQCEYYALEGLSALLATVEQIRTAVNANLELEGILRTMFDPRNNLANEVSAQLIMHFGDKVFRTIIPRNIRLAEAPSFGKPVLFHDRESRGALAYLALAGEMIRREEEELEQAATAAAAGGAGGAGGGGALDDGAAGGGTGGVGTADGGTVAHSGTAYGGGRDVGMHEIGMSMDGMHDTGMHESGMSTDGMHDTRMHESGMSMDGMHDTGMHESGMSMDGMHDTGMHESGMSTDGMHDTGMHESGRSAGEVHDGGMDESGRSAGEVHDGGMRENGMSAGEVHDGGMRESGMSGGEHDGEAHESGMPGAEGVPHDGLPPDVAAGESGTEAISSEGTDDGAFVPDPHTVHTDR